MPLGHRRIGSLIFYPSRKPEGAKKVKKPYRGTCRRLKGFKTLIWETMGESAQKKIPKM
jgi:hypothetical protein